MVPATRSIKNLAIFLKTRDARSILVRGFCLKKGALFTQAGSKGAGSMDISRKFNENIEKIEFGVLKCFRNLYQSIRHRISNMSSAAEHFPTLSEL